MKEIKLLVWADGVVETGFSKVAHSIVRHLPENYKVSWLAVNYQGDPHPYHNLRIYPAMGGGMQHLGDIYGVTRVQSICNFEKPDVIFIINDAWVQNELLAKLKEVYKDKKLPKIVSYVPVDAADHDSDWYKNFDIVEYVVAYTEFGKREILKAAPQLESKISIITHGTDSDVFYKIPATKKEIKKSLYPNKAEFYDNSFIVLCSQRNQPRKRLDIAMESFKFFAEGKPENVKLYMHSGMVDSHIHLQKLSRRLGIENRMIVTSGKVGIQNAPVEKLNLIYNATDVGINVGLGEGFGLGNIEHVVTGSPQVVADHSSLRELYYDCGLLVPAKIPFVLDNIMTTGYLVRAEDAAEKLELLYTDKELYKDLSERGLAKFTSEKYSWKHISEQWQVLFED